MREQKTNFIYKHYYKYMLHIYNLQNFFTLVLYNIVQIKPEEQRRTKSREAKNAKEDY